MPGVTHRFLNINDDWEDPNNWDTGLIPGSGGSAVDTAIIDGPASGASQSLFQNLDRTGFATATLTLSNQPITTQTVTIRNRIYTFEVSFSDTANFVFIGATTSDSLDNLIAAINNDAGEGTTYGTGTVEHADVSAAAGAGDTMVITAKTSGFNGLYVNTSETLTFGSWGDTTMSHDGGSLMSKLDIRGRYDGDIGTDGARLDLSATNFEIRSGGGTLFHALTTSTNLRLNSDNRVDALIGVGGYTNMYVTSGAADIGASGCTNLFMGYRNNPRTDAYVIFSDASTVIDTVRGNAGVVEANGELTNIDISGACRVVLGLGATSQLGPNLVRMHGGARLVFNVDTNISGAGGTIGTIYGMGGTLDGSHVDGPHGVVTLHRWPGFKIQNSANGRIDVATTIEIGD